MSSPVLWGPNSKAINLEQGTVQPDGTFNNFNGPKNYVSLGNFANGLATGWSAVGCATLSNGLLAAVGSGSAAFTAANGGRAPGANTTAPAVSSTTPLDSSAGYSLNLATSGAGTIGDMYISQAFNIDVAGQGRPQNITLDYKVMSGTPSLGGNSSNTYALMIYDMVNNAWIVPSGVFNFVQLTGAGRYTGSFQTPINMVGFQIAIYSPAAPTGASSLYLNNIYVGPSPSPTGPARSDMGTIPWTPTGSWSTNTTYSGKYGRDGDTAELSVAITLAGAPTAATLSINMPPGLVIDTTKLGTTSSNQQSLGSASILRSSVAYYLGTVVYTSSTTLEINLNNSGTQVSNTAPATMGAGDFITFHARVPIVGWSSNSVMSSDTDTRVIAAMANTSGTTIGTSTTQVVFTTTPLDTAGGFTASVYKVPVTGVYSISWGVQTAAVNLSTAQRFVTMLLKNGTEIVDGTRAIGTGTSQIFSSSGSIILPLVTGDTLQLNAVSSVSVALSNASTDEYFSINRLSGPAVVSATESVNARYYQITAQASLTATDTQVNFDTKDYDTHNAVTTGAGSWKFTAPVSGKYRLSYNVATSNTSWTLGQYIYAQLYKNGSAVNGGNTGKTIALAQATQTFRLNIGGSDSISLVAGDYIDVRANSNGTAVTPWNANGVWIAIERIGN